MPQAEHSLCLERVASPCEAIKITNETANICSRCTDEIELLEGSDRGLEAVFWDIRETGTHAYGKALMEYRIGRHRMFIPTSHCKEFWFIVTVTQVV